MPVPWKPQGGIPNRAGLVGTDVGAVVGADGVERAVREMLPELVVVVRLAQRGVDLAKLGTGGVGVQHKIVRRRFAVETQVRLLSLRNLFGCLGAADVNAVERAAGLFGEVGETGDRLGLGNLGTDMIPAARPISPAAFTFGATVSTSSMFSGWKFATTLPSYFASSCMLSYIKPSV